MCGKLGWAASTVFCGSVRRLAGDGVATGPPCRGQGPLGQQAAEGANAYVLGRASDRRPGAAGAPTPDWPGQCPPLGRNRDLDQPGPTGPTQGPGSMQHTAGPEGPAFPQAADCLPPAERPCGHGRWGSLPTGSGVVATGLNGTGGSTPVRGRGHGAAGGAASPPSLRDRRADPGKPRSFHQGLLPTPPRGRGRRGDSNGPQIRHRYKQPRGARGALCSLRHLSAPHGPWPRPPPPSDVLWVPGVCERPSAKGSGWMNWKGCSGPKPGGGWVRPAHPASALRPSRGSGPSLGSRSVFCPWRGHSPGDKGQHRPEAEGPAQRCPRRSSESI